MQQYFAYTDELQESGKLVSTAPLQPTATSQSVRVRDGRTSLTDPYAETKEQLGGYDVTDVDTRGSRGVGGEGPVRALRDDRGLRGLQARRRRRARADGGCNDRPRS